MSNNLSKKTIENNKVSIDETNGINNKTIKVKKNITIFKKKNDNKIINIKPIQKVEKKSMDDALEKNEVNLWGLNIIDSILLKKYDHNQIINKKKSDIVNGVDNILQKTKDLEFDPEHTYTWIDLDFLNKEYDRIEKRLEQMIELNEEYEELIEKQDLLSEIIDELKIKEKIFYFQNKNESPQSDIKKNPDIKKNITNKITPDKNVIAKHNNKSKSFESLKLKPYYYIGEIPKGYREATEEEAITNKKVSFYGKKKVDRELYNLFDITGTIYINTDNLNELNNQIFALRGKLRFYKKEYEYNKIYLDSDNIDKIKYDEIKEKMQKIKNSYKKTLDLCNLYIKKYNSIKKN